MVIGAHSCDTTTALARAAGATRVGTRAFTYGDLGGADAGAPVMVLQPFMPTCLLAETRADSVEMSAEESSSTSTTGRGS